MRKTWSTTLEQTNRRSEYSLVSSRHGESDIYIERDKESERHIDVSSVFSFKFVFYLIFWFAGQGFVSRVEDFGIRER